MTLFVSSPSLPPTSFAVSLFSLSQKCFRLSVDKRRRPFRSQPVPPEMCSAKMNIHECICLVSQSQDFRYRCGCCAQRDRAEELAPRDIKRCFIRRRRRLHSRPQPNDFARPFEREVVCTWGCAVVCLGLRQRPQPAQREANVSSNIGIYAQSFPFASLALALAFARRPKTNMHNVALRSESRKTKRLIGISKTISFRLIQAIVLLTFDAKRPTGPGRSALSHSRNASEYCKQLLRARAMGIATEMIINAGGGRHKLKVRSNYILSESLKVLMPIKIKVIRPTTEEGMRIDEKSLHKDFIFTFLFRFSLGKGRDCTLDIVFCVCLSKHSTGSPP